MKKQWKALNATSRSNVNCQKQDATLSRADMWLQVECVKIEPPVTGCDNFHDVTTECENACGMHPSQSSSLNIQMLVKLYKQKLEMEIGRNVFSWYPGTKTYFCLPASFKHAVERRCRRGLFSATEEYQLTSIYGNRPGCVNWQREKKKKHAHKMPLSIVITQHVTKWSSEALWCR